MSREDVPYDDSWADPCSADEPVFEDGPLSAGGGAGLFQRGPRLSDGTRPERGGSAPAAPASAASAAPAPAAPASPSRVSPVRAALNGVAWIAALAGVFFCVLLLEVVGALLGAIVVGLIGDFTSLGAVLSDDDRLMLLDLVIQYTWLIPFAFWWRSLGRRGIGLVRRRGPRAPSNPGESPTAQRVFAVVLLGVGLQIVISLLLTLILPLFPEVMESYNSMMDDSGTTTLSLLGVLSVAVTAPVVEEITFRGVAFQFALRAVCPGWSARATSEDLADMPVSPTQFWAANLLQAAVFGAMHLNITQGLYAFAIGLVCGWLFWRTGELQWSMGMHAALNLSSYFVSEILAAMSLFGLFELGQLVFPVLFVYWGVKLFERGSEDTALG